MSFDTLQLARVQNGKVTHSLSIRTKKCAGFWQIDTNYHNEANCDKGKCTKFRYKDNNVNFGLHSVSKTNKIILSYDEYGYIIDFMGYKVYKLKQMALLNHAILFKKNDVLTVSKKCEVRWSSNGDEVVSFFWAYNFDPKGEFVVVYTGRDVVVYDKESLQLVLYCDVDEEKNYYYYAYNWDVKRSAAMGVSVGGFNHWPNFKLSTKIYQSGHLVLKSKETQFKLNLKTCKLEGCSNECGAVKYIRDGPVLTFLVDNNFMFCHEEGSLLVYDYWGSSLYGDKYSLFGVDVNAENAISNPMEVFNPAPLCWILTLWLFGTIFFLYLQKINA